MRLRCVFLLIFMAFGSSGFAEPSRTLGIGRLFTNDYLGDGHDRWQSGSYVASVLRGPRGWAGSAESFGAIREYRFRSAVIASDGRGAAPGDRPYVGILSFGLHSHYGTGTTRSTFGIDLTAIGPQTGMSQFQSSAHSVLDMPQVRFTDQQLGNDVFLSATAETAEMVSLSDIVTARPFAEVQFGPEDLVRVGVDVLVEAKFEDDVLIRDVTTGQLYRGTQTQGRAGFSLVVGADYAAVADSLYLPGNLVAKDRGRVRAGLHWQGKSGTNLFYGLTYLTPEFQAQGEGQVTGSVKLIFNF